MKTRKHFIPFVVALIIGAGFLVAGHLKSTINNPPIAQASSKEATPTCKTAERRAFAEGVFLVQDMSHRALRDKKDILAGLESIEVLVEALHPRAEKYGLTRQVLHNDTELRLRMHGIKVGTEIQPKHKKLGELDGAASKSSIQNWRQAINAESDEDFLQFARETVRHDLFNASGPATLYINLATIVFEESYRAAFAHRVELQETAYLSRNGAFCRAPVWYTGGVGACSLRDLKEYAREALRDDVDEFINAYLAANPKDRSSEEAQ